jgi:hypothetical protein
VQFRITPHSGYTPPADALETLWQRLGTRRDEVSFAKIGSEITARTGDEAPVSMTRDERVEIGRRAVLSEPILANDTSSRRVPRRCQSVSSASAGGAGRGAGRVRRSCGSQVGLVCGEL